MRSHMSEQKTTRDLKHLLESSSLINKIFHDRQVKKDAEKKAAEELKAKEDAEYKEVIDANKSLKDSLAGKNSSNTLAK